jgi:hypothetical protein
MQPVLAAAYSSLTTLMMVAAGSFETFINRLPVNMAAYPLKTSCQFVSLERAIVTSAVGTEKYH